MHTCMRCGREIKTMEEMQTGCTCGSKAFIFTKSYDGDALPSPSTTPLASAAEKAAVQNNAAMEETAQTADASQQGAQNAADAEKTAVAEKGGEGALPPVIEGFEAQGAQAQEELFVKRPEQKEKKDGFEIENVRLLESGVFEVDMQSLAKNPLVLKDQNDVYYVKLPVSADANFFANGNLGKLQESKNAP